MRRQDGPVVLVGSSFGCRLVAGLLKQRGAAWRNSAVMVSYPLYGDNARSDRVAALREVNADSKLLFHSGSRDEYLDRSGWRGQDVPTGRAALEAVVSCNATYSIVGDGVGHSACGSRRAKDQLQAAIEKLLRDDDARAGRPHHLRPPTGKRSVPRAYASSSPEGRRAGPPRPHRGAPAPPTAPAAPPSIKEMKETIRRAGLATADLLERPHVEARIESAAARLAKVVDVTVLKGPA